MHKTQNRCFKITKKILGMSLFLLNFFRAQTHASIGKFNGSYHWNIIPVSVLCNMKSGHCDMGPLCEVRSAPCNVGVHLMIWVRYVDIPMELNTL